MSCRDCFMNPDGPCAKCSAPDWADKAAADLVNSPTIGCCADSACDYDCTNCKSHINAIARALRASVNPAYKMAWDMAAENMTKAHTDAVSKYFSGEVGKVGYIEVEMECKHCGIRYCPHEWVPVSTNVPSATKEE